MPATPAVPRKRVTLSQIASYAGVSPTTTSFVLSRRQDMRISARTERRVLEAARALGYVPRRTTPAVPSDHPPPVGFLSDTVAADAYSGDLLRGCGAAAVERDRLVVTAETDGTPEMESFSIDRLIEMGVTHYVLAATGAWQRPVPNELVGRPLVLLNCIDPAANVPAVLPDDRGAGRLAATTLLENGHSTRIHVVGAVGPSRLAGHNRLSGINDVLRRQQLGLAGVSECEWLPTDARSAVKHLLDRSGSARPTAIIAMNDRIALGVYQAAAAVGLVIPDDLAVISFDDSPLAHWLEPGLSSIALPYLAMGRLAVQLLLEPSIPEKHYVPMALAMRQSIARALPSGGTSVDTKAEERFPAAAEVAPRTGRRSAPDSLHDGRFTALDELPPIGHPGTRALRDAGFMTLTHLAGVPRRDVTALNNVGPRAIATIQHALEQHGLSLT